MGSSRYTRLRTRPLLHNILAVLHVLATCFMTWKALCLWADTPNPAMVVITESMEPAFHRGDIILVSNCQGEVEVGDLPVCWFTGSPYPMVHRVVQVMYQEHEDPELRCVVRLWNGTYIMVGVC